MTNNTRPWWASDPKILEADFSALLEAEGLRWWETEGKALSQRIAVEEMRERGVPFLTDTTTATATTAEDGPRQWWTPYEQFEKPSEPPTPYFSREDSLPLAYRGSVGWLYGPPSYGKTWVALMGARQALEAGFHVAYVDYETGRDDFKERALILGIFDYLKPDPDRLGLLRHIPGHDLELGERAEIGEWASGDDGHGLVIIDSAGSSGCPDDGPAGVPEWIAEHLRPFTLLPDDKRPAVLVLDHVAKNPFGRMPGPIGAQAKMREVTGIAMRITGNPWTRTEPGSISLVCEKDRRGFWQRGTEMSTIIGTWTGGAFGYQITEPEAQPTTTGATDLRQAVESAIYDTLEDEPPMSFSRLKKEARQKTRFANSTFDTSLRDMIEGGLITKNEHGRHPTYHLTKSSEPSEPGLDPVQ